MKRGTANAVPLYAQFLVVGILRAVILRRSVFGVAALAAVLAACLVRRIVCIRSVCGIIRVVRIHDKLPPVMNVYRSSMRFPSKNYTCISFKSSINTKIVFFIAFSSISNLL